MYWNAGSEPKGYHVKEKVGKKVMELEGWITQKARWRNGDSKGCAEGERCAKQKCSVESKNVVRKRIH